MFTTIQPTNTRRFTIEGENEIFAIYDQCKAYTKYAPVGMDASGNPVFVGMPVAYFDDEVTEIKHELRTAF